MTAKPPLSRAKSIAASAASTASAVTRSGPRGRQTKPGARPAEPLTKRDQLVETAWYLFYRDGYHATGIDRVLAQAGVAKMTLYKHFRSKEELILAVLEKRSSQFQESLARFLQAKRRTPEGELLAVFDWLIAWVESKDFRGCLFQKAMAEYQETNDPIHRAALAHKAVFHGEIRRLVTEAGLVKPKDLGDQLAVLAEGAIVISRATGSSMPTQHARDAAQALIRGAGETRLKLARMTNNK